MVEPPPVQYLDLRDSCRALSSLPSFKSTVVTFTHVGGALHLNGHCPVLRDERLSVTAPHRPAWLRRFVPTSKLTRPVTVEIPLGDAAERSCSDCTADIVWGVGPRSRTATEVVTLATLAYRAHRSLAGAGWDPGIAGEVAVGLLGRTACSNQADPAHAEVRAALADASDLLTARLDALGGPETITSWLQPVGPAGPPRLLAALAPTRASEQHLVAVENALDPWVAGVISAFGVTPLRGATGLLPGRVAQIIQSCSLGLTDCGPAPAPDAMVVFERLWSLFERGPLASPHEALKAAVALTDT